MFYFTKVRDTYRKRDDGVDTVRLQLWLMGIGFCNLLITTAVVCIDWSTDQRDSFWVSFFIFPYVNVFIRPVLFSLMIRSVKSFWRRYITVIVGSLPMVIFILVYVFYFAWMGNRLFAGTIEGVETFSNLNDSFFYMFVLLTTSNFPDVMLPSYGQERRFSIFFITYLVIGLFMLLNMLLAIFYSNYQERVDASIDKFKETRNKFFIRLFRKYDKELKGEIGKEHVFKMT
jgi:two pore calcium channel protein